MSDLLFSLINMVYISLNMQDTSLDSRRSH